MVHLLLMTAYAFQKESIKIATLLGWWKANHSFFSTEFHDIYLSDRNLVMYSSKMIRISVVQHMCRRLSQGAASAFILRIFLREFILFGILIECNILDTSHSYLVDFLSFLYLILIVLLDEDLD